MARRSLSPLLLVFGLRLLAGCSNMHHAERPAWRASAENACFAERRVSFSAYIQPAAHELNGPSICGLTRPLKVTALQGGAVLFSSTQTLDCSMVAELDAWLGDVVQPAAMARFGQPVAQVDSMGSYNCRGMNNQAGARLSEHSFGNALDVGGFQLADGRKITLVRDWTHGDEPTQAFLRDVHRGACEHFTTVLAPGSNPFHYNHIHVDLALHGMTSTGPRRICKPYPQLMAPPSRKDDLPEAPEIDDDIDMAHSAPPRDGGAYAMHRGPDLTVAAAPVAMKPAVAMDRSMQSRAAPAPAPRPLELSNAQRRDLASRDLASHGLTTRGAGPMALHTPPAAPEAAQGYAAEPQRGHLRADGAFEPDDADPEPTSRIIR